MSELSVTKITDRVGTGKVNFSQGFKVAGTLDTTLAPTRTEGNTEPATPVNGDTWYDTDNDTYDVYINDEWKRFLGAGGGAVEWTVYLSNVTYDNVSFYVGSQNVASYAITFSTDGTKMYMAGLANPSVYQYTLSTAFDLSTASYDSVSFSIYNQERIPTGIKFKPDGTKMYITGQWSGGVLQYSLSTAFDISTVSYDSVSITVSSQDSQNQGIAFSTDGTKMYMTGVTNKRIYQYSLSTAFDLSTASYDSVSLTVNSQDSGPHDVAFNTDGTKMYMFGITNDKLFQYSLSTAFDLSTASYDSVSSVAFSSQDSGPIAMTFSADGTKIYIFGNTYDRIYQYSTGL